MQIRLELLVCAILVLAGCKREPPIDSGADMFVKQDLIYADIQEKDSTVDTGEDISGVDLTVDSPIPDLAKDIGIDEFVPDIAVDLLIPDTESPDLPGSCTQPTPTKYCSGGWCDIPAGCFVMGAPADENCNGGIFLGNETQHEVTLTHSFEMSATEVTIKQFDDLMGYNNAAYQCGDSCPVQNVDWHEAAAYCNQLSLQQGWTQCYECVGSQISVACTEAPDYVGQAIYECEGYRLPTEAEWEYAYRAGTTTALYTGDLTTDCKIGQAVADAIAWYNDTSELIPHPVAELQDNAWGLFDMSGNVWEWCHDHYVADLGAGPATDPWGPGSGTKRTGKGGSWFENAGFIRAAVRMGFNQDAELGNLGFRCVKLK